MFCLAYCLKPKHGNCLPPDHDQYVSILEHLGNGSNVTVAVDHEQLQIEGKILNITRFASHATSFKQCQTIDWTPMLDST